MIRERKKYFVTPSDEAVEYLWTIAEFVIKNYRKDLADEFLRVADPLLIAQAKADNSIVVTLEGYKRYDSHKIQIPNICEEFHIEYITPFQMLRDLSAKFIL